MATPPPGPDPGTGGPAPFGEAIREYRFLLHQSQKAGRDVSRAMELNGQSIESHRKGDREGARLYLDEAILQLKESGRAAAKSPGLSAPYSSAHAASPFAIHGPYIMDKTTAFGPADITGFLLDIHARAIRIIAPEIARLGAELDRLVSNGVLLYADVGPESETELRHLVAANRSSIRYWRVGNEPDAPYGYQENPETYLDMLKRVYTTIKSEDPEAHVSIGGLANGRDVRATSQGPAFLKAILDRGGGEYFDIFAFHFQGSALEYEKLKHTVEFYRQMLASYGYDKPIWITEFGTYSGQPAIDHRSPVRLELQSEAEQAMGMVKFHVYGLGLGVDKMFWSLLVERHRFGGRKNSYFDNIGLIHNPCNNGENSGGCSGSADRKLSYHTYRFMVETLDGTDWDRVKTVLDSNGTYVYRFPRLQDGPPVWVAWSDAPGGATVFLDIDPGTSLSVVEAVPAVETGAAVDDAASTAFKSSSQILENQRLQLTLTRVPVYVTQNR